MIELGDGLAIIFVEFLNDQVEQWSDGLHECVFLLRLVSPTEGIIHMWYRQYLEWFDNLKWND